MDLKNVVMFDRAILINTEDDVEFFISDPKGYLEKVGALEGLPEFNGVIDSDGNKIESLKTYCEEKGITRKLYAGHMGIPYRQPYYCSWLV